jgi:DNA/RNA endonuclease G (NUC1)
MTINKNVVSLDEIRSRALYKLKMASCRKICPFIKMHPTNHDRLLERVEFSFCMTKHKHNVFAMDATVNNALFAAGKK